MSHIFISHATADDAFVAELRRKLEMLDIPVWVDSRNLRGGEGLDGAIRAAIGEAEHFIAVLSPQTINSAWVADEIEHALKVQEAWDDYQVIPLLLPGIKPGALRLWFGKEPLGVPVEVAPGALAEAMPAILAAIGIKQSIEEQFIDEDRYTILDALLVDELVLELEDPRMIEVDGVLKAQATATLVYQPGDGNQRRAMRSRRYPVTAPMGPVELEEIRWYLEEFFRWPVGIFADRARKIEAALPDWGQALFTAVLGNDELQGILNTWENGTGEERRLSIFLDPELPNGATPERIESASSGASLLLSLPWELLHDGSNYLLHGGSPVAVRRRLPNRYPQAITPARAPIRILLLSPRPELTPNGKSPVGYIDHRASALPLVEAVENLGELARLTVLHPPTLPALQKELGRARDAGTPYHVVHFDAHGVYDRRNGLGSLLFEAPEERDKLGRRVSQLVHADRLAALMRDHAIPLVMLEACQGALLEEDLNSVAIRLLWEGVSSVVAMSYTVLVETARRFVQTFYRELAQGGSVGRAVRAGQTGLEGESFRIRVMGAGALHMQDWFVPVLYQDAADPRLFSRLPSATAARLIEDQAALRLGELPRTPAHAFVGRSRELLRLERLLMQERYAVVRGSGGAGKTTLAVEAARWLVRSHRFARAAFVSLEEWQDERAVLDVLARQLLPGDSYSVAEFPTLDAALQPVRRALREHATVIVVDNVESVLDAMGRGGEEAGTEGASGRRSVEASAEDGAESHPASSSPSALSASSAVQIFSLCEQLLAADDSTRLIFTSREGLPGPFDKGKCRVELGALSQRDAVALVKNVLTAMGRDPKPDSGEMDGGKADGGKGDDGNDPQQIVDLVEAVNRHARALVLLARALPESGVSATTEDLHALMAKLEAQHPGDRKNSLFASVALSLRRLPAAVQETIKGLAVVHGGGHLHILGAVMGVETDEARAIAIALINVGMADDMGYGYLRLDPALAPYLAREMDPGKAAATLADLRARWADAMMQLVGFLYQQRSRDAQLQAQLTLLELPNLLALVAHLAGELAAGRVPPERVVDVAGSIEQLLAELGRPAALARAVALREAAAEQLGDWSRAQFQAERLSVERLLAQGDGRAALQAAQALHGRSTAAGEDAYDGAAYDMAMANWLLGRVLRMTGQARGAIAALAEAQTRFQALADGGDQDAARMASAALTEQGDCLTALGRLDEAAARYEESVVIAEELDDQRQVAVNSGQLGTVRMLQQRHADALAAWDEARRIFQGLGEPAGVATAWHQMGRVHSEARQWEAAERAYRESMVIKVQQGNKAGQASSLNQLGNLYNRTGRLEEAVVAYRQAADLYVGLGDLGNEGRVRNNIASTLVTLGRLDEARQEIQRAIECKQPFGHAARIWASWGILQGIEVALGRADAAQSTWFKARDSYLAYRRDGGYPQYSSGQLFQQFASMLASGDLSEARDFLTQIETIADGSDRAVSILPKLEMILGGDRDPALADDIELYFDDSAELLLLLERLGG